MGIFTVLAQYNQWMNNSFYEKCMSLGQENIEKDQHAFFNSILTTLNHLLIADIFWLSRCTGNKAFFELYDPEGNRLYIKSLDQILYPSIVALFENRQRIDKEILSYVNGLSASDITSTIEYRNSKGDAFENKLELILLHWFNHQTHHRGQVSAMLSQQGVDYGLTDLIHVKDLIESAQ